MTFNFSLPSFHVKAQNNFNKVGKRDKDIPKAFGLVEAVRPESVYSIFHKEVSDTCPE